MSAYLKLIKEMMQEGSNKTEENKPLEKTEPVENINLDSALDHYFNSKLPPDIDEKIENYTKNSGVFELVLNNALKKNDVSLSEIDTKLEPKEKEQILSTVFELIKQFEEMYAEEEVDKKQE